MSMLVCPTQRTLLRRKLRDSRRLEALSKKSFVAKGGRVDEDSEEIEKGSPHRPP